MITLQNMKKMEETLPSSQFIRVHKSYIISLDKIESIERSRITIFGKVIPIGDTYRDEFFKRIANKKKLPLSVCLICGICCMFIV